MSLILEKKAGFFLTLLVLIVIRSFGQETEAVKSFTIEPLKYVKKNVYNRSTKLPDGALLHAIIDYPEKHNRWKLYSSYEEMKKAKRQRNTSNIILGFVGFSGVTQILTYAAMGGGSSTLPLITAYLPFIGTCGTISFFKNRKYHREKKYIVETYNGGY